MSPRDGDGWIQCACGNKHWGLNGAAGILLLRGAEILLQHRAPWVHNGDTWGIPGGARDSHESVLEAAIREAKEETGIDPVHLTPIQTFSDDHGTWRYDTVIASATDLLIAHELNDESHEVRWVHIDQVDTLTLHPSFEKSWPELKRLIKAL
jgi:8-oxo-dGTP diphosphatase